MWDRDTTWGASENGYLECLRYAHKNGCEWDPNTTWGVAYEGQLACLKYIYEHCGDVATWENSNLEYRFEEFPKEIQDYIDSVREDWKHGLNRQQLWKFEISSQYVVCYM